MTTESTQSMETVLIVAASPLDLNRLRLSREVKRIKQALERSRHRENWRIESNEAATVEDLRRALLDHQPTIVHFSGHGGGDGGLCFEDDQGFAHSAHAAPLARLFHHFKDVLKCVVLNACYSTVQGEEIRQQIDYVVGMQDAVEDEAAEKFAVAFYDAIFAGTSFRVAFDLACTAIDLHGLPEAEVPVFLTSPQLGGTELVYTEDIPEIENILLAYLNTPYAERYTFTTKGGRLAKVMRQFYGDKMLIPVDEVKVISKQALDSQHWKVRVRVSGVEQRDYYLQIRGRSIKIEWEASVGLWSMPVKTYLALGTEKPILARVIAELDNTYHGAFYRKHSRYQSIKMKTTGGEILFGYVTRGTVVFENLLDILKDGEDHEITLSVRNVDHITEHMEIVNLLSRTWIMPDEEDRAVIG